MQRGELDGLSRAGFGSVEALKLRAYCEACDHEGNDAQNLRFHVEWIDAPEGVLRIASQRARGAA